MDDGGERGALVLLEETPVADVLEPSVGLNTCCAAGEVGLGTPGSRGEDLLAVLAQLSLRPDVTCRVSRALIPSSPQSTDTEVSRCAIAAWASRTWAFDRANFLPPLRPRARAALSPARVRSRILRVRD